MAEISQLRMKYIGQIGILFNTKIFIRLCSSAWYDQTSNYLMIRTIFKYSYALLHHYEWAALEMDITSYGKNSWTLEINSWTLPPDWGSLLYQITATKTEIKSFSPVCFCAFTWFCFSPQNQHLYLIKHAPCITGSHFTLNRWLGLEI